MDHTRFDRLTARFAHGATRRALVHRLAGTGLAALLGTAGLRQESSDARGRNRSDKRRKGAHAQSAGRHRLRAQARGCGKKGRACCAPDDSCRGKLSCVDGVCTKPVHGGGQCQTECPAPLVPDESCQCACPPGVACCVDGACPAGQDCNNWICSCRGSDCTAEGNSICVFGRTCQDGGNGLSCCCSLNGNPQFPCGPGPNPGCCSGFCGADGFCAPPPA
jgi:hypothetical protein